MKRIVLPILLFLVLPLASCRNDSASQNAQQPQIAQMTPAVVNPGQSNIVGHILGTNLNGFLEVNLGDGVTVHQTSGISATDIYVFFSVSGQAPMGPHQITVRTSQGIATSSTALKIGDNRLPVARFVASPPSGYAETLFRFDGSASTDADGGIANYQWNFEDGTNMQGKVITHKFKTFGIVRVTMTVTDNRGGTDHSSKFLDVAASRPPVATFNVSPTSGDTNTNFTFDGSSSRDPDGRISEFRWAFGDGTSSLGTVAEHRFPTASSYAVSLIVVDNTGMTNFSTQRLDIAAGGGPPGPPPPNGGEICSGSNFDGQSFNVVNVSGRIITGDATFVECPGLCGEIRRNAVGIREFVGDVSDISGNQITYDPASLPASTAPQTGELLKVIWRNCG